MKSTKSDLQKPVGRGSLRRAQQQRRQRVRLWTRVGLAVVVVGVTAAVGGVILASGPDTAPADADGTELELQLGDYFIAGDLQVPAGKVRVKATNVGGLVHNVGVRRGPISTNLRSTGDTTEFELGELVPGEYELYCDVDDHVAQGMVAILRVTEPEPAPSGPASTG